MEKFENKHKNLQSAKLTNPKTALFSYIDVAKMSINKQ